MKSFKLTLLLIIFSLFIQQTYTQDYCDTNCEVCEQTTCKKCTEDLNRVEENGKCVCQEGFKENVRMVCEETSQTMNYILLTLCILLILIFFFTIFKADKINPMNFCNMLNMKHKPLNDNQKNKSGPDERVHPSELDYEQKDQMSYLTSQINQTNNNLLINPKGGQSSYNLAQSQQQPKDMEDITPHKPTNQNNSQFSIERNNQSNTQQQEQSNETNNNNNGQKDNEEQQQDSRFGEEKGELHSSESGEVEFDDEDEDDDEEEDDEEEEEDDDEEEEDDDEDEEEEDDDDDEEGEDDDDEEEENGQNEAAQNDGDEVIDL